MRSLIPLARPVLEGNEKKYLIECVESGFVTHHGRFEREFEQAFSKRFGAPALATSSGTGALHLALLSQGIGHGDEVIVPALTFGATASVVLAVGAKPIIVDINPDTFGLDQRLVLKSLTRRTRAIIPVHLYGEDAGDFTQFGIPVIEDACESLGMVPIRGKLAAYSFYGNKVLTTGEGGMLCGELGNAKEWRDGGFDSEYRNTVPGLNYRMSNMQAAVGLAQLECFDTLLSARQRNARLYADALPGRGRWLFVVEVREPVSLAGKLREEGVDTRPVFTPLHRSPAFRAYARASYRGADKVWESGLCLPTGPHLTEEQITRVIELVSKHIRESANGGSKRATQG